MRFSRHRLVMAIAPWLLGGTPVGQERIRAEIEASLTRLERWSDVAECREELVRLGPSALGELFDALAAAFGVPLDAVDRAAIESVFASFPRHSVLKLLERERGSPEDRRLVALRLLARTGTRDDLGLAFELAAGEEHDAAVPPPLRAALEETLLAFHERDPATLRSLAGRFENAHPSLQAPIARVLARSDDALALLAGLLGSSPASDGLLLLEIGRIASSTSEADVLALERVRGYLGHPDARLAILAIVALEKLSDHGAVPDLIALLDHRESNVKTAAHRALADLTGVSIDASSRAWLEWLDDELAWWDERESACRQALASGPASAAAAAILELAHRHLYRDKAAEILKLGLERAETDVVISSCKALAAMRARSAIPALVELLGHPESPVRSAALRALRTIEGHSNPASASAWRQRLRLED